jgi:hypothetical protein
MASGQNHLTPTNGNIARYIRVLFDSAKVKKKIKMGVDSYYTCAPDGSGLGAFAVVEILPRDCRTACRNPHKQ